MGLEAYRRKRDFSATPEPEGKSARRKRRGGAQFTIQKHAARRLHYDLRLEHDGVLWSWAVTRGPSLVPGDKRLAVRTEDHPLDYAEFEGTIPKGEYGGGTVLVWDVGTWKALGDPEKGAAKGHLEFELAGKRLSGRWHLVRMARKPREKAENWLLIKGDDAAARGEDDPDVLEEHPESVLTGRTVEEVAGEAPGWSSKTGRIAKSAGRREAPKVKGAVRRGWPGFVPPALATLRPDPPAGDRWVHEIKFDGYRFQAHLRDGGATLLTRHGHDWTGRFGPEIRAALEALPAETAIVDGELVVESGAGVSDFGALQADLAAERSDRFVFYAFDLLYLDGRDLRAAPLTARKEALAELIAGAPAVLRFSEHFEAEGEIVLRHSCRLSLEGVVSKLRDGKYVSGRGKGWIKSKCQQRQEFVVLGHVPSSTGRNAIGALLIGHYDDGRLTVAGKVGTGFTQKVAEDLFRRLEAMRTDRPELDKPPGADLKGVRFVRPELVAEVEYLTWTADGVLRHTSFRGLREDRDPREVVREPDGASPDRAPVDRPPASVKLTHPDRLYWKDAGVTKQGLAEYYAQVWRRMAPHVVNRPLALLRCPDGVGGQCFFQKHAWRGMNREILGRTDPLDDGKDATVLAIDGLAGLTGVVQGGALEIHTWQSTIDDLERPDQIVMDLDPGEDVAWPDVIAAAREVRERLNQAGLASFLKTSGGKGLHVVAPLTPKADWARVKGFAKSIADAMTADSPDRFIATITKSKRRGKVLIDYLRNGRGSTAIAPYATRARDGAPVSMPLAWEEIDGVPGAAYYTVRNAIARIAALDDPWDGFRAAARPCPEIARPRGKRAKVSQSASP
jgi:bifunctional non-homologous end joining protein LigD